MSKKLKSRLLALIIAEIEKRVNVGEIDFFEQEFYVQGAKILLDKIQAEGLHITECEQISKEQDKTL